MIAGSLFTGYGGFDLGLEAAGFEIAWQCEIDEHCNSVLRRHWPKVQRFKDVHDVRSVRQVDVLAGGFPCQDLSVAGRRAGLGGERSGLWWEFHRIIGEQSPAVVLVENVPGLLSSWSPTTEPPSGVPSRKERGRRMVLDETSDLDAILCGLEEFEYGWAYRVLDSQYFGLAQRRKRVFIIACAGGRMDRAAEILFESNCLPWHPAPSRQSWGRVAGTISARTKGGGGLGTDFDLDGGLIGVVSAKGGNNTSGPIDTATACNAKSTGRYDFESETLVVGTLAAHSKAHGHAMGTQQADESGQLVASPITAGYAKGVGVNDGQKGSPQNLIKTRQGVRRLMPVECERLQGLPDGHTAWGINEKGERVEMSDSARYRMIGNGVSVPVIEWIAKRTRKMMESML